MGAGDHHGRQVPAVVGAPQRGERHHAVHEGARDHRGHLADLAGDQALLDREEAAAEALGVADHGVDPRVLDRVQDLLRLARVGGERLLDEQIEAALDRGERRRRMVVLVGRDDHRGDLGAREQLGEALGEEVGAGVGLEALPELRLDVAQASQPTPG